MGILSSLRYKLANAFLPEVKTWEDYEKRVNVMEKSHPFINAPVFSNLYGKRPEVNYESLWRFVKHSPEIVSIITAISEDIVSDEWTLVPAEGKSGRNKILRAQKFLDDNNAKQETMSMIMDSLVTGDGYFWKGKLNDIEVKNIIESALKDSPIEFKADLVDELYFNIKSDGDEDIFRTKKFIAVPSSTMFANYDENGNVKYWEQRVRQNQIPIKFTPEEIVHFRYLRTNGEFYGFSPMRTLLQHLNLLEKIVDYSASFFERGGMQNIFTMEEETPSSPNYQLFRDQLTKASSDPIRWKNMLTTGKLTVNQLNPMNKDMEFRQLAQYVTQVLLMSWNMPTSRLSDAISEKGTRGETLSAEGYYRKISHQQDLLEDLFNKYLLKEYGVKLKIKRSYRQDEIREVQIDKIMSDVVEQRLRLGLWNEKGVWDYLNIAEDNRGDIDIEQLKNGMKSGQMNQNLMNNHQSLSDTEKLAKDQDKQKIAVEKKSLSPFEEWRLEQLNKTIIN